MARRRRGFETFSLSFIDCMSCGLGAVILLFMIINHASQVRASGENRDVTQRLARLESEVLERQQSVAELEASLSEAREATESERRRAEDLAAALEQPAGDNGDERASRERIATLQSQLRQMESRVEAMRKQADSGDATRSYRGEGNRQYLTGLRVGGERVLILLDVSASMLDDDIVNVIRRRNMGDAARRGAPKWRRAVAAVDWLTTQVPADARFQIYGFSTDVQPALADTLDDWQGTDSGARLTAAVRALDEVVPGGGTSLVNAFAAVGRLSPPPDNVYLVTDGLPTQGSSRRGGTVSSGQRLDYFRAAVDALPGNVPVNVVLLPMEGDPYASSALWQLAQRTGGGFVTPAEDWP